MRNYNSNKMCPSMAITFYLRKPNDAVLLFEELEKIKNKQ